MATHRDSSAAVNNARLEGILETFIAVRDLAADGLCEWDELREVAERCGVPFVALMLVSAHRALSLEDLAAWQSWSGRTTWSSTVRRVAEKEAVERLIAV